MDQAEIVRLSQCQRQILKLLQEAAPRGLTTRELLNQTGHMRVPARIWELRKAGYPIFVVEGKRGVHTWFYASKQLGLGL